MLSIAMSGQLWMYLSCSCKFLRVLCYIAKLSDCHVCLINTQTTVLSKCNFQYKPQGTVGKVFYFLNAKCSLHSTLAHSEGEIDPDCSYTWHSQKF